MNILLHDYGGRPSQLQLGRQLAHLGHDVSYLYADFTLPKAFLGRRPSDPMSFRLSSIETKGRYQQGNYVRRQLQEIAYGRRLTARARELSPDLVICSDTPLVPLNDLLRYCRRTDIPFVFWMMDVRGHLTRAWLNRAFPGVGFLLGSSFVAVERWIARRSDHLILISDKFLDAISDWKIPPERVDVLPLWGSLDDVRVVPKENSWSRRHGLDKTTNLIYAGSLGTAHTAGLLVDLARGLADRREVRVVVLNEGPAMSWLIRQKTDEGLDNLVVLPFQPPTEMSEVFGAADVLLTMLNAHGGNYTAPGKVLSHCCAGRAQLGIMPPDNGASRWLRESRGGVVVWPPEVDKVVGAARSLIDDKGKMERMGCAGRAYAEQHFDIRKIGDAFESVIVKPFNRKATARPA